MLSPEGQELLKERNRVPASTAVETNLNKLPFQMIDPVMVLDEDAKWEKLWSELFLKGQASEVGQSRATMGKESHYNSKKDRVFVRGIQGQYSLKDELARLRAHAARHQGQGAQVQRRPAVVQQALRRAGRRA